MFRGVTFFFCADYADLFKNVSVVDAIASLGLDCDEIASNILALTGHRPACDVTPLYHKLAALLWIVERMATCCIAC
jgi:hypothetical protein